jgi:hypothetical protein
VGLKSARRIVLDVAAPAYPNDIVARTTLIDNANGARILGEITRCRAVHREERFMHVELGDDVTWCDIQNDVVILNLGTGVYFGLEGAGGQMWRELVEHRSLEKAFEALKKRFDVKPDDLRRDLEDMVRQLAEKGLVSLVA